MKREIITMKNTIRLENDINIFDQEAKNIKTIDDLIKWSNNFKEKITTNLKEQGLKKDDIISQYHAVGLAVAYNLSDIPFNKSFLDTLDQKNQKDIMHLIRLGNALRYFALIGNKFQYESNVKIFFLNNGKMLDYKDYYKEV